MQRFFTPAVGSKYNEGIRGKKILVLGASFYCQKTDCKFFKECTSVEKKDSSKFDSICPEYVAQNKKLHDEPGYCVDGELATYTKFTNVIGKYLNTNDSHEVWKHLSFTNYIQFFLPVNIDKNGKTSFRQTMLSDMSERDFGAFIETLHELKPDIVIIWGCVINTRIRWENEYVTDKEMLDKTEGYLCHMQLPGSNHKIALVNPYHPSYPKWYDHVKTFEKYLEKALNE